MDIPTVVGIAIAGLALLISLYNLWYSTYRRGELDLTCSRWMMMSSRTDVPDKMTGVFMLSINAINTGTQPIALNDLVLQLKTHNGKLLYYHPSLLFDTSQLIESLGLEDRYHKSIKGGPPLPVVVPATSSFDFGYDIVFSFDGSGQVLQVPDDAPFVLNLYALTSRHKEYKLVATQTVTDGSNKLGSSELHSFSSIYVATRRREFVERQSTKQQ